MNDAPVRPETLPGRKWKMRVMAALLPLVLLLLLELVFRLAGLFPDTGQQLTPVGFAPGTNFFPEWDSRVTMPRPEETLRVFVLGGSTTHGYRVEKPFGMLLQEQLSRDGREVEVINAGYPAYGSHRVLEIARRAVKFQPDLLVVYMGHNEFLEDVFYDPEGTVARWERAGEWARQVRVVNGLRQIVGTPRTGVRNLLPAQFTGNMDFPLIHSDGETRLRLELLAEHVRGIVAAARSVKADVVFIPAAVNLLWPPGDSLPGPGVDVTASRWVELQQRAEKQFELRQWQPLLETCRELEKLDDRYAQFQYWKGVALLGTGDVEAGRASLVLANRQDYRGDRINPDVAEAIAETAREAGGQVLRVERLFGSYLVEDFGRLADGQARLWFLDHCHPSQEGHELIATAIAASLAKRTTPSPTGSSGN